MNNIGRIEIKIEGVDGGDVVRSIGLASIVPTNCKIKSVTIIIENIEIVPTPPLSFEIPSGNEVKEK